jgi:hypothetical protein
MVKGKIAIATIAVLMMGMNASLLRAQTLPTTRLTQTDIDWWTDELWYRVRPQMRGQDIRPEQQLYQREWAAIRQVIPNNIEPGLPNSAPGECGSGSFFKSSNAAYDLVADAVFYARHPEIKGREIVPGEPNLVKEWQTIRKMLEDALPMC